MAFMADMLVWAEVDNIGFSISSVTLHSYQSPRCQDARLDIHIFYFSSYAPSLENIDTTS